MKQRDWEVSKRRAINEIETRRSLWRHVGNLTAGSWVLWPVSRGLATAGIADIAAPELIAAELAGSALLVVGTEVRSQFADRRLRRLIGQVEKEDPIRAVRYSLDYSRVLGEIGGQRHRRARVLSNCLVTALRADLEQETYDTLVAIQHAVRDDPTLSGPMSRALVRALEQNIELLKDDEVELIRLVGRVVHEMLGSVDSKDEVRLRGSEQLLYAYLFNHDRKDLNPAGGGIERTLVTA